MNSYVRKELGDRMLGYDLSTASFYGCYEEITGRPVVDNQALITAVSASHRSSELLNVAVGDPLIWFRGVSYVDGGIPVEVCYSLFVADRFQFQTNIYRPRNVDVAEYEGFSPRGKEVH
jgi:DNA-binding GntR family transcriptional regulator